MGKVRTVGEDADCVVGGHVAVDGDGVEGTVDGVSERGLERARGDGCVGEDETEEGCVELARSCAARAVSVPVRSKE